MKRVLSLIAALSLGLLMVGAVFAQERVVILEDDFELYISQPAFGGAYQVTDGRPIARLSTAENNTEGGMQSVMLRRQMGAVVGLPSGLASVETRVAIRSNGAGTEERGVLRLRWSNAPGGAKDLLIGIWPSLDNFVYRDTLAGIGWTESSVARSEGWHEIAVYTGEDGTRVLIDGVEVYQTPDFKGVSSVGFVDFWSAQDAQMLPVYFDDLLVATTNE